MTTSGTLSYSQHIVVQKLAAYFKVKKDLLRKEALEGFDEANKVLIYSPTLKDTFGFGKAIYCTEVEKVNLADFLYYKKFLNSRLFDVVSIAMGCDLPHGSHGVVTMAIVKGFGWTIYKTNNGYGGEGGIFVGENYNIGYIIEPIDNYLNQYKLPEG